MLPLVMGVLNVTPDSFSDGGRWFDLDDAVEHGLELVAEGADIVDVGGESTRPGADAVDEAEEMRRVVPVIAALAPRTVVSVDTTKAAVAEAAIAAGATIVNDVSASLLPVVAAAGPSIGWIAMHMRGTPRTMQDAPAYDDVVTEVRDFLCERAAAAAAAGVERVWIDPGIGFGKTADHNAQLLHRLETFVRTGVPVAVGTSRKRFLAPELDPSDRDDHSLASAVWAMAAGVAIIRVHAVRATVQARDLVARPVEVAA